MLHSSSNREGEKNTNKMEKAETFYMDSLGKTKIEVKQTNMPVQNALEGENDKRRKKTTYSPNKTHP